MLNELFSSKHLHDSWPLLSSSSSSPVLASSTKGTHEGRLYRTGVEVLRTTGDRLSVEGLVDQGKGNLALLAGGKVLSSTSWR